VNSPDASQASRSAAKAAPWRVLNSAIESAFSVRNASYSVSEKTPSSICGTKRPEMMSARSSSSSSGVTGYHLMRSKKRSSQGEPGSKAPRCCQPDQTWVVRPTNW
jgi:hypothetical protein